MHGYLLIGTALALSTGLAIAQPSGSTGSGTGTTGSAPSATGTPSSSSTTNSSTSSPSQAGSQSGTTTPATTNTNSNMNSRTGATGTDRSNTVLPPNSPSTVTPAYTTPGSPGSYNPNTAGISGGSTAALDLKHGTKVSKLKDAKTKLVGAKLVDTKGEAIGEVASVTTQRSGRVTHIVVALDNGRHVTVAAGPLVFLADNNMLVTHQSAKSFDRMHHGR